MKSAFRYSASVCSVARQSEVPGEGNTPSANGLLSQPAQQRQQSPLRSAFRLDAGEAWAAALLLLFVVTCMLSGCGTGGYPGGGITAIDSIGGLSKAAVTIDAGQSFPVTAVASGAVTWSMGGCTAAACGTLVSTGSSTAIYTAPSGLAAPIAVVISATMTGTTSMRSLQITVNPDPALLGTPALGFVGQAYSTTLSTTGGTTPVAMTVSTSSLPSGLVFNPTTNTITGTPGAAGTYPVPVQLTDASGVPSTYLTTATILVKATPANQIVITKTSGPAVLNTPFTASLQASGGTAPYTFGLTSGALPPGLAIATTGVISGTPSAVGTSSFAVQAQDASGLSGAAGFSITVSPQALMITTAALPNGTVNLAYSATVGLTGGTAPYNCTVTSGTLPAGLSMGANCVVSGTPSAAGTVNLVVQATDSSSPMLSTSGPIALTIAPAALSLGTLPNGTVNLAYNATIGVTGGTAPYSCAITSGNLPAGLSLGAGCDVSGTPTVAGTTNLTVKATDSGNPMLSATGAVSIAIAPGALSITTGSLPNGTVNLAYNATIGVTGGTGPYSCTITSGTLPAGLSLGSGCVVSGTPSMAGTANLMVKATDSSNPMLSAMGAVSLTISPAALSLGTLPNGTVGIAYNSPINVNGGTEPYSCTITSGTLPTGLSLGAACVVSGTPSVAGTVNLGVKATDSSNPALTTTGMVSLTIAPAPLTITSGTLPDGIVGTQYSATVPVSGGTAPYNCVVVAGVLPPGLTMAGNCTVSGLPTIAGTETVSVRAVDSGNPTLTYTRSVSITINPVVITMTVSGTLVAMQGTPFAGFVIVSGGTLPYTCQLASGSLPAGLVLNNSTCAITGTPTSAGTTTVSVKATDSSNPAVTGTGSVTITVNPALVVLIVTPPPPATAGSPYTGIIGVTGGKAPYSCALASGALPAGLTLGANCTITGTPATPTIVIVNVTVTDSGNPAATATAPVTVTVVAASPVLTLSAPPQATVGIPYTGTIGVTGGTGPYSCAVTLGTLPSGLTMASNCTITGTPATAGTTTVTVQATDSTAPIPVTTFGPVTITVNPAPVVLTLSSPPVAVVVQPYIGTVGVSGGTSPYSCTLASGTMPAGLTLGADCKVTGTPTAAGATTLSVTATDSGTPAATVTGPVTITVNGALALTGSLPNAKVGVAYTQSLTATGGIAPYTYALTAGALPAGLSLAADGTISGTPTAPGATSFTVTATDSEGTQQTASLPLVLLVVYPPTPQDPLLKGPYAFLFQGYDDSVAGVLAYQTAAVGSFTADGTGVVSSGELDANHQASNPTRTTVATDAFLGTYTIGPDDRGSLTITTLNADGTTASTSTCAIAVKLPHPPGTVSPGGSLIEADDNQLQGTKGSGTFLVQTAGAALSGSYAFGLQGDTPCQPACTVGISAGPAAAVGQFTVDGNGNIPSGTGDETIASTTYASSGLAGTYGAADDNGRVQLSLTTMNMPLGVYPVDYAVYVVDANQAFVMSTDKHSAYVLLSGSAHPQTQSTFSNASLSGPYIGYENAATNPGLVGAALQNVANLSTATVFRGTANSTGTCTTTNVDVGGTAGLVNGLTGLGSGSNVLNALLGTYQSTGNSNCTVAADGRGILNYPVPGTVLTTTLQLLGLSSKPPAPRVVYLYGPDQGYFLETGYAGLGQLETQTGAPFSLGTLDGMYVYQTSAASSAASTDTSGVFTADGKGNATTTYDLNTGVGTVNLLQLGVTGTSTYTLKDATAGRFLLGANTVIYAVSPDSFLLLDTSATTTSPSVALLF